MHNYFCLVVPPPNLRHRKLFTRVFLSTAALLYNKFFKSLFFKIVHILMQLERHLLKSSVVFLRLRAQNVLSQTLYLIHFFSLLKCVWVKNNHPTGWQKLCDCLMLMPVIMIQCNGPLFVILPDCTINWNTEKLEFGVFFGGGLVFFYMHIISLRNIFGVFMMTRC